MMQKSSKQDSLIMYISHQRKQLLYRSVTLLCLLCIVSFCLVLFVTSRFSRFLQFVQQHDKVILHCHHGKNRSAAAATAWVAVKEDIECDQAAPCLQVLMLVFFLMFFSYIWRFLSQAFTHWWHCVRNVASSYFGKRTWRTTWRWMWAALSGLPAMLLQQTKVFVSKTYKYTCLEDPGLTPFHFSVDVFSLSTWGTFRSCCLGTRVCWGVIKHSFCVHSFCVSSEHGCQAQDLDKTLCISES